MMGSRFSDARRRQLGGALPQLLLLLGLLVGGGAWNYHRNVEAEKAEDRPFRGHTDEALGQLIDAYEQERDRHMGRLAKASGGRAQVRERDYFEEQVVEFERVSRQGRRKRALRDEVAANQVTLKRLKSEQGRRDQERDKLQLFMKRVLTF